MQQNVIGEAVSKLKPFPSSLTHADLSLNNFGTFIGTLPPLPANLTYLNLSHNVIASAISQLQALPINLRHLDLSKVRLCKNFIPTFSRTLFTFVCW